MLRSGQPELVSAATEADLAAVATDAAHLAQLCERGITSYMLVPLASRGQDMGVLTFSTAESGRRYTPEDLVLAQDLARRAALALTNARLHRQIQDLTMLRERERIGRDLHDGIIQDLYALMLQLDGAAADAADGGHKSHLQALAAQLSAIMGDIRAYIQGLPAQALQDQGLPEALGLLVQEIQERGELTVTYLVVGPPVPVPLEWETMLLQITREALSNVVKHTSVRQAAVRLAFTPQHVELAISDDGPGFDAVAIQGVEHHGLRNMRNRTAEAGGTLDVQSATGAGTTVQVRLPL